MNISLSMVFYHITNPICICGGDIESINRFFLICPEYCEARQTFFDNIQSIDKMLLSQHQSSLTHLLLYDDPKRNSNVNAFILNTAIEFILSSGRFNRPLLKGASNMFSLSLIHFSYSFCLFIRLCYLSFLLIFQVFATFYIRFFWAVSFVVINFFFLSFLVSSLCKCVICWNRKGNIVLIYVRKKIKFNRYLTCNTNI